MYHGQSGCGKLCSGTARKSERERDRRLDEPSDQLTHGEKLLLERFFHKFDRQLRGLASRRTTDPDDADECFCQMSCQVAQPNILRTWGDRSDKGLMKLAKILVGWWATKARKTPLNNRSTKHDARRLRNVCLQPGNRELLPPADCIDREHARIVRQAVRRIRKWRRRRVLILVALGCKLREIAARLNITVAVAHREKSLGLRELQATLPDNFVVQFGETMRTLAHVRRLRDDDGLSWAVIAVRYGLDLQTVRRHYSAMVSPPEAMRTSFAGRVARERGEKAVTR